MTINPHPSHCAPSLELKSHDILTITSPSLIYHEAKNVKNGLHRFTRTFAAVRGIASTKTLS